MHNNSKRILSHCRTYYISFPPQKIIPTAQLLLNLYFSALYTEHHDNSSNIKYNSTIDTRLHYTIIDYK